MVSEKARAKVNLSLHVTGQRPDGYHLLDSLVVFPDIGDDLSVTEADALSLAVSGPFAPLLGSSDDNLVLRAARALDSKAGALLHLTKNLPVASGVGGGSSDAAATLRILNRFWNLKLTDEELERRALDLGADAPVCVVQRPAFIRGIGEILAPAPTMPSFWLVLVNPGAPLSTPAVFTALAERENPPIHHGAPKLTTFPDLTGWLGTMRNDLQSTAEALCPVVADAIEALANAGSSLTRMSGSGATCFGLFQDEFSAAKAAAAIGLQEPGWWVAAAQVRNKDT